MSMMRGRRRFTVARSQGTATSLLVREEVYSGEISGDSY